jgi:hypothetical protein
MLFLNKAVGFCKGRKVCLQRFITYKNWLSLLQNGKARIHISEFFVSRAYVLE